MELESSEPLPSVCDPHWRHLASRARVSRSNVGCRKGYSAFLVHPHVLGAAAETPELGSRVGGPHSWVSCSEQRGPLVLLPFPSPGPQGSPGDPLPCAATMGLCLAPFGVTFPSCPASQGKLVL